MSVWGLAWGPYWGNSWGSVGGGTVIPGDCVLSRLAIAVQGIGYGYRLTATQGMWCVVEKPPVDPDCVLSPMAIALQGVGYGMRLTAVQGFSCVRIDLPEIGLPPRIGGGKLSDLVLREDKAAQRFLDRIRGLEDAERIRQTWDEIDALRDRDAEAEAEAEADGQRDDVEQSVDSGAARAPSAPAPNAPAESAAATADDAADQALQIAAAPALAAGAAAQDFTDEDMDAALVALCLLAFDD